MCRLFALISNKEVNAEFSFLEADHPFIELAKSNHDGWGLGYYKNNSARVFKEPKDALHSRKFQKKAKNIKSKIIIAHIRSKTQGKSSIKNTHPFKYKSWIFAHNGNIDIKNILKANIKSKYLKNIEGETDSELFFYWLLQNINESKNISKGIKKAINFVEKNKKSKTDSLNFILSDGNKLFALRDAFKNKKWFSLYYLTRKKKEVAHFKSKETKLSIKHKLEKAVILCSEKLTRNDKWNILNSKELITINKDFKINKITI